MTSVSAGHIIQTQPVGSGRPQRGSNLVPPEQLYRLSYRAPRERREVIIQYRKREKILYITERERDIGTEKRTDIVQYRGRGREKRTDIIQNRKTEGEREMIYNNNLQSQRKERIELIQ